MTLLSLSSQAQLDMYLDLTSLEALYYNHRQIGSLLVARAAVEQANEVLHDAAATAGADYKDIEVELDKYTRAFDILDMLVSTLHLAGTAVTTYEVVSRDIEDYTTAIKAFSDYLLEHPTELRPEDERIIAIARRTVSDVSSAVSDLWKSFVQLSMYTAPVVAGESPAACSVNTLSTIINSISDFLVHIRESIEKAYYQTLTYVRMRLGYWNDTVYPPLSLDMIIDNAFGRWLSAGLSVTVSTPSK